MTWSGPVGVPIFAWITKQVTPYSSVRDSESCEHALAEESEV
jgi:hypothetical protein